MKKKNLKILLVSSALFALTSCNSNGDSSVTSLSSSDKTSSAESVSSSSQASASSTLIPSSEATSSEASSSSQEKLRPFVEETSHLQEGTLHEVSVEESGIVLAENETCAYSIVYDKNNVSALKAANLLYKHINLATGAEIALLPIDESTTYTSEQKWIVLEGKTIREQAGITDTDKNLDVSGYQIDTKDSSCFLHVGGELGYQQAALAFLRNVLGYNRYSSNIVTYTKVKEGRITLPKMAIVERPDFAYHTQSNKVDETTGYEMGFLTSSETFFYDSEITDLHNSFMWLPKDTYQAAHPNWYSLNGTQICYTARGDKEEYEAMVKETASRMLKKLATNSTVGAVTFSIQDNQESCTCPSCQEAESKYGAASGSVVKFINAVDDIVQASLEEEAKEKGTAKREVDICFFAYNATEKPCAKLDENGNYVPTSEDVICNEHVGPYIAPIGASYTKSFYNDDNESFASSIKGWGALSKRLYLWLYETNFNNYLYPLNTFSSMGESYRFLIENNALYLYNEGQHNNGATTAFGRFKEYFNSVSEFNVNASYPDIVDDFFTNYFGPAKETMLTYFQELQEQCAYIENTYYDINGTIYNKIAQARFWPKRLLMRWLNYIEEAKQTLAPLAKTDAATYQIYLDNITLESIFPRYALLNHYGGTYSRSELQSERSSFRSDCQRLNVTMESENTKLESIYTSWGF
jgi:hypothetical protein